MLEVPTHFWSTWRSLRNLDFAQGTGERAQGLLVVNESCLNGLPVGSDIPIETLYGLRRRHEPATSNEV